MNFIQKYNISKQLNRFLKWKEGEDVQICSLEEANHLCVFYTFETSEGLEEVRKAVCSLKRGGRHVALYCYVPKKKNVLTEKAEDTCFITEKDFDFKGSLSKEKGEELQRQSFDVLIDLDKKKDSLFARYLIGVIKAGFRIGRSESAKEYYHVVLYSSHEHCTLEDYFRSVGQYTNKVIK